jgi:hypothetical protein
MGNRSRYGYVAVAAAASSVALAAGQRRGWLHRVIDRIRGTISPTVTAPRSAFASGVDEVHAPGHRHRVAPLSDTYAPGRLRGGSESTATEGHATVR